MFGLSFTDRSWRRNKGHISGGLALVRRAREFASSYLGSGSRTDGEDWGEGRGRGKSLKEASQRAQAISTRATRGFQNSLGTSGMNYGGCPLQNFVTFV